jgi:glycosyltransferase involved in cell wall biosynthesis
VEAMSYALPIIVSPGVAVSQAVEEYQAGKVTPANEFQIAEAINSLTQQISARKQAGDNARAYVETHLAWSEIVKYLGLLYAKLAG